MLRQTVRHQQRLSGVNSSELERLPVPAHQGFRIFAAAARHPLLRVRGKSLDRALSELLC